MTAADLGGRLLATATAGLSAVRAAAKPLHPTGEVYGGRLARLGSETPSGIPWIDEAGDDAVLVRLSRGGGLPRWLPDVHGLALRAPLGTDGYTDVLLASTGWSRVGRHLLVPGYGAHRVQSTLMPYRGPHGPVLIGARPGPTPDAYTLYWAQGTGPWSSFAELQLDPDPDPDAVVSFDPMLHPPPGLGHYRWAVRLREPAYDTARESRAE